MSGNPMLFLAPLNGSLAFQDRAGGGTLTGSGAVRYAAASGTRTNYAPNPRFASGTGNYTGNGSGTITRIASDSLLGTCGEVVGSSADDGVTPLTANVPALGSSVTMTVSFDAYLVDGASDWQVEPSWRTGAGGSISSGAKQDFTPTAAVQRFSFTVTGVSGAHRLYPKITRKTAVAGTLRFTNLCIEVGSTAGTWFDPVWLDPLTGILGSANASPSVSQAVAWVEEGTTNTVPDPSFEAATITTNWTAENAATISKVTTHAYSGSNGGKVSCTATTLDGITQLTTSGSAAANGQPWTIQARVRAFASGDVGKTITLAISERTAANAFVKNNISGTFTLTDAWQLCSYTVTLSGGGTVAKVIAKIFNGAASAVDFVLDAVQLEQKAYATSYCDGSIGTGYAWSGTAHASSSTRTATVLNAASTNRMRYERGTLAARALWDYDTNGNQFVFGIADAGPTNRIYLYRVGSTDKLTVGLGGSGAVVTESGTTAIDTWVNLVMQWDGSNGTLYKDATLVGGPSAYSSLNALHSTLYPGSLTGTSQQLNGYIGPVLIADRPLTAKERAMLNARTQWAWSLLKGRKLGRLTPI